MFRPSVPPSPPRKAGYSLAFLLFIALFLYCGSARAYMLDADAFGTTAQGGGMYTYKTGVTFKNHIQLSHNKARQGGFLYAGLESSTVFAESPNISDNTATNNGGAFYLKTNVVFNKTASTRNNRSSTNGGLAFNDPGVLYFLTDPELTNNVGGGYNNTHTYCYVNNAKKDNCLCPEPQAWDTSTMQCKKPCTVENLDPIVVQYMNAINSYYANMIAAGKNPLEGYVSSFWGLKSVACRLDQSCLFVTEIVDLRGYKEIIPFPRQCFIIAPPDPYCDPSYRDCYPYMSELAFGNNCIFYMAWNSWGSPDIYRDYVLGLPLYTWTSGPPGPSNSMQCF